jgi:hypothetical protein
MQADCCSDVPRYSVSSCAAATVPPRSKVARIAAQPTSSRSRASLSTLLVANAVLSVILAPLSYGRCPAACSGICTQIRGLFRRLSTRFADVFLKDPASCLDGEHVVNTLAPPRCHEYVWTVLIDSEAYSLIFINRISRVISVSPSFPKSLHGEYFHSEISQVDLRRPAHADPIRVASLPADWGESLALLQ